MITEVQELQSVSVTDEIDFAQLTGFQPDVVNDAGLAMDDFSEDPDPEQHRTIRGIVGSPFSKIALVGGVGFLGFLLVGLFMNSIMSPSNAKQLTVTSDDPQLFLNPMVDPKDAEIAKFKTDLALGSQLSGGKLKTLSPTNLPKSDSKVDSKDKSETNAEKTADVLPAPPVRNLSVPSVQAIPMQQVMSQPTPVMLPPRNFSASQPEAKDPAEEWQRLASIGSYGNLAAPTEIPRAIAASPIAANNSSIPTIEKPSVNSLTNYLAQAEKSLPKTASTNTLLVGTTAKAALKTSVVFSTDGSRTMGSAPGLIPKFIVTLQEPITTADGKPVIPADAVLIVTARPLDAKSGLAELDVVGIAIAGRELIPPPNAITLRGAEGSPLIADKYFDRGSEISGMDAATFITSALAEVGKLTNTPTTTSSISSIGGSATISTAPPPNYLGAAISGGFGILAETLNRRSQEAIEEIKTRPNVFFIPAGKELQVFVNQTMTF
ncbi:TrbI/VirB10 family protein [Pseudanabaena sp. FACHB-1998]|uniref:TrbI/VirB10 family protein n=1 Tax=Pseudanabaena sp. FACHB-1998 TaxID=2692858 RepID=UPI001681576E|nr:TrbI/VirB10 family protein [Pseudanabaena sp. FACHB-1998]